MRSANQVLDGSVAKCETCAASFRKPMYSVNEELNSAANGKTIGDHGRRRLVVDALVFSDEFHGDRGCAPGE